MNLLHIFISILAGAALGARIAMAWPKDKARIIKSLEDSLLCFWQVEFFIEQVLNRTDDPEIQAEGKRALACVLAVKRAWRNIRAQDFEQGKLFGGKGHD